jgi:hypothetical protein
MQFNLCSPTHALDTSLSSSTFTLFFPNISVTYFILSPSYAQSAYDKTAIPLAKSIPPQLGSRKGRDWPKVLFRLHEVEINN